MSQAGRRRTAAEWSRLLRELERSGQSPAVFARARGIRLGTLKWWRWRLNRETKGALARPREGRVQLIAVHPACSGTGAQVVGTSAQVERNTHALARRLLGGDDREVDLVLFPQTFVVTVEGQRVQLTHAGFALFEYLVRRREHWFTDRELLRDVVGNHHADGTPVVRGRVKKIRAVLGPQLAWILQSRDRQGYCVTLRRDSTASRTRQPHPRFGSGGRPR